jgi:hypothetical protein
VNLVDVLADQILVSVRTVARVVINADVAFFTEVIIFTVLTTSRRLLQSVRFIAMRAFIKMVSYLFISLDISMNVVKGVAVSLGRFHLPIVLRHLLHLIVTDRFTADVTYLAI